MQNKITEHPINLKADEVLAILEGRKTQIRRIVKIKSRIPGDSIHNWAKSAHRDGKGNWVFWSTDSKDLQEFTKKAYPNGEGIKCPYGKPGDHLWVRETWGKIYRGGFFSEDIIYKADRPNSKETVKYWRSPIYMPREASRITLEVINLIVDRLHENDPWEWVFDVKRVQ